MYHNDFHLHRDGFGQIATPGYNHESRAYLFENQSLANGHRHMSSLDGKRQEATAFVPADGGLFGYVVTGSITVERGLFSGNNCHLIKAGQFFTTPGTSAFRALLNNPHTRLVVFQRVGYVGMATIGEVEAEGRLGYIDGCRDTVLHGPFVKGLPCLNALFMPAGIHQTSHTHPSVRLGVIIRGAGLCQTLTPEGGHSTPDPGRDYPLQAGDVFFLPPNGWHKFRTDLADSPGLNIVAYHPDSDFGPTDEEHPMLNRTEVEGVSARDLPEIRTKVTGHSTLTTSAAPQ